MRVIPVLDLKAGQVVHAVGGRRDEYRPIRSRLVDSSDPAVIARAFRDQLGLHELYVADLDAIAGSEPAWDVYRTFAELDMKWLVDAGVRNTKGAAAVHSAGATGVVLGLETITGPHTLREIAQQVGADALWFSLDLKNGEPLGDPRAWQSPIPEQIVAQVVSLGIRRIIVLDLAHVGERRGTGTEDLCRRLILQHPQIELVAGGGVRDDADLKRLHAIGLSGVLVATLIHSGWFRHQLSY